VPAVFRDNLPLVDSGRPCRRQVGQPGQDKVFQPQGVPGNEFCLPDAIQTEQGHLHVGQFAADRLRVQQRLNLKKQVLGRKQLGQMVQYMQCQLRYQGLETLEPHGLEQPALSKMLFNEPPAGNQKFGVVFFEPDIDDELILNRVVLQDIERIGNHGITLG